MPDKGGLKDMKIKWFNVSSFMITTEKGIRVITDPFAYNYKPQLLPLPPDFESNRPPIAEYADVVTLSHGHFDHSYVAAGNIKGVPKLYTGGEPREYKGVKFSSIVTWHDNYGEGGRGLNNIIGIEADGIRIKHMGDYGQPELTDEQLAQVGRVDILMTPWGNFALKLIEQLKPKVVLPIHHTTADQVKNVKGFTQMDNTSELEFIPKTLPSEMKVIMLKPSLEMD
jgi:L-ascorbate metabolism protein UlaG (beta-lactamase superfamily)